MNLRKFFLLSILIFCISIVGCTKQESNPNKDLGKIKVSVSLNSIADIVKQIGGDEVELYVIVPPGANPHVFEPVPEQLVQFANSNLFVQVGAGLEFWKEKFINSASTPPAQLELIKYVDLIDGHCCNSHDEEHELYSGNPHFWTSPKQVMKVTAPIRDMLISLRPEKKSVFEANCAKFDALLKKLDLECEECVQNLSNKNIIDQHAAWSYFARDYKLNVVGVIEASPGKEPGPKYIQELIDNARAKNVKIIFADMQSTPKSALVIASEIGAKVLKTDPAGNRPNMSYEKLIRYNLNLMRGN